MPRIVAVLLLICFCYPAYSTNLYVATNGNDLWSGRLERPNSAHSDGPMATLEGARNAVRRIKKYRGVGSIHVIVKGGTYSITAPLVLTPGDSGTPKSPIIYEAAPGSKPIFFGGRTITGWRRGLGGTWQTKVPQVASGKWYFEQLWVDGVRMTRARTPNTFYNYISNVVEQPLTNGLYRQTIYLDPHNRAMLTALCGTGLKNTQLVVFQQWTCERRYIESVDPKSCLLTVTGPPMDPLARMQKACPYYIENSKSALDMPGEWFLSRDGVLTVNPLPGQNLKNAVVVAPIADQFLAIQGNAVKGQFVSNVVFKGLDFQYAQWLTPRLGTGPDQAASSAPSSVMVDGAKNVALQQCKFSHAGTYGIWLRKGCMHDVVQHCLFQDMGGGGVRIGDVVPAQSVQDQTSNNWADNNIIYNCGKVFLESVGIWIGHSGDNRITHNDVGGLGYTGISVGWSWAYGKSAAVRNMIAYNRVHNVGTRYLADMGGIYTLGVSPGTVVKNNIVHDVRTRTFLGNGIYTDEGSSGILIENNLVYNCDSCGYFHHYGKNNIVRNNIFALCDFAAIDRKRIEPDSALTVTNNICYQTKEQIVVGLWMAPHVLLDWNLYYPGIAPRSYLIYPFPEWQKYGHDTHSLEADPLFVDPLHGDFRLKPGSPASKIGFKPIDYSKAGVYGDQSWTSFASHEQFATVLRPPIASYLVHSSPRY